MIIVGDLNRLYGIEIKRGSKMAIILLCPVGIMIIS